MTIFQSKKLDILVLLLIPLLGAGISLLMNANFLTSIVLFFGLPGLWLSFRPSHQIRRALIFALIFAIPFTLFIDYIAIVSAAWIIPFTVFPFRVFGVVTVEEFIWGILLVYSVVMVYEYFFDQQNRNVLDPRMKYLIGALVITFFVFLLVLFVKPELLVIPYAYFWVGLIVILLPASAFIVLTPTVIAKFTQTAVYFFYLGLVFELIALHLGQWEFPADGYFIGWVELLGYRFPFEEFFYWLVMGAIGILSYYEFFNDDRQ